MTRGTRLLIMCLVLFGVILLMMDCAKKTMKKKKPADGLAPQGLLIHTQGGDESEPALVLALALAQLGLGR